MTRKLAAHHITLALSILTLFGSILWAATEHTISQKDKKFSAEKLSIKVGDTVSFPNEDPIYHNIYSLSSTKIFDLGSYKKGETKRVTFDKPGTVDVRCAIHPGMKLTIEVAP